MRSSVVFPAPFGPRSATNSPAWISSDTPRKAHSDPNRFSTRSKRRLTLRVVEARVVLEAAKGVRSTSHKTAQKSFDAQVFTLVFVLADRTCLAAKFKAKQAVF